MIISSTPACRRLVSSDLECKRWKLGISVPSSAKDSRQGGGRVIHSTIFYGFQYFCTSRFASSVTTFNSLELMGTESEYSVETIEPMHYLSELDEDTHTCRNEPWYLDFVYPFVNWISPPFSLDNMLNLITVCQMTNTFFMALILKN